MPKQTNTGSKHFKGNVTFENITSGVVLELNENKSIGGTRVVSNSSSGNSSDILTRDVVNNLIMSGSGSTDVSYLSGQIDTNTSNINTNTSNINTNTSNIASNDIDITTLQNQVNLLSTSPNIIVAASLPSASLYPSDLCVLWNGTPGTDAILYLSNGSTWNQVSNFYNFYPTYGSIYKAGSATQSINSTNHTQINVFDTNLITLNTNTDHTNDHITINTAGIYEIKFSTYQTSGGATAFSGYFLKKNNAITQLAATGETAITEGNINLSVTVALAPGDTIEAWIGSSGSSGFNVTLKETTLSVHRIG